ESSTGVLPSGVGFSPSNGPTWGWGAAILPQLEQKPLFDSLGISTLGLGQVLADTGRRSLLMTPLDIFRCPSDTAPETNEGMYARQPQPGPGPLSHDPSWTSAGAPAGFFPATANYVANAGHKALGNADNTGPIFRG